MLEESKKAKEGAEKVEEGKEDQETNSKKNKTKKECKKLRICSRTTYLNIYDMDEHERVAVLHALYSFDLGWPTVKNTTLVRIHAA